MNYTQAFGTLYNEIGEAINESLARYSAAIHRGDLDAADSEQDRQRTLLNARTKLEALQRLWPRLVGLGVPPPLGGRTQLQAFVLPILMVLQKMGGTDSADRVIDQVGREMSAILSELDLSRHPSGSVRWRVTAGNARVSMVRQGLLADDAPRGIWRITERGRAYLRSHAGELSAGTQPTSKNGQRLPIPDEGLPVYAVYKGKRYEAILLPDRRIRYGGQTYGSPSRAGLQIVPYDTVNGWSFWRYLDDQGQEHFITDLRNE